MSDELKAKLLEIIERIVDDNDRMHQGPFIQDEEWLAQIDQAYKDAGYVRTLRINGRTIVANGKDNLGYIVFYPEERLTGQEWYERFQDEYFILRGGQEVPEPMDIALEAAKRAAGLK